MTLAAEYGRYGYRRITALLRAQGCRVNAKRVQRFELPSAMPYMITGLEVGSVLAIIGTIVGEYLGDNAGLSHLLIAQLNAFETDQMFAVLMHMSILDFVLYLAIGALRRLLPWHASASVRV